VRRLARSAALAIAASVAVALGAPSSARADAATDQARVYFDAGAQAYAAGRYPVAIEAFSAAYRLAARPAILFSTAQAERKQFWIDKKPDGLAHAIQHYRAYLAQVPEGARRDDAATALGELEPVAERLGAATSESGAPVVATATRLLVSSQAPNAQASIDGQPAAALPRLVELPAGKHHVAVTADGFFPDERDVVILAGVTTPVELNLREQPGQLTVLAESGASVLLDGRVVGDAPLAHPIDMSTGHHTLAVAKNGRQLFHEDVSVDRGRTKTVIAPLLISRQRRISEVVMGTGAVGLLAGGAFLGIAFAEQASAASIAAQRQVGNISPSQLAAYNSELTARDAWRTASLATAGAGLGVLIAGGALFLFDRPTGELGHHAAEPTPTPGLGPAGCGCSVEVSLLPVITPGFGGAGVVGRF
jgi:hypothetical protein